MKISKGEAAQLLCERIQKLGHEPVTLDLSILRPPPFEPSISSIDVADEIGRVIAGKLNQAKAPVKFLVPLLECDTPNRVGEALHQPEIIERLIRSLQAAADPRIVEFRKYDLYLDTPEFAEIIADTVEESVSESSA